MQNPCQLAHWHACCTSCKTRANLGRASCWHECCTPCKTHANLGPGTNVATQAKHVPLPMLAQMLHPCNTRATSNVGTDVAPLQYSCHFQCWHRCCYARSVPIVGQMLGRGRGLTCVDNCSSHSGTKKVKTRKKEP